MTAVENILQRSDMEVPRKPRELCDWVNSKALELSQTREGKAYARSGEILPKKLWEEVRPLGLFAFSQYGTECVMCTPNLSNDNYDGTIEFTDKSAPKIYVEITYAKDGHDERLRLDVLTSKGSVNALGKITVSGTKASGRHIEVENEAVEHTKILSAGLALLEVRLAGKSNKQYGQNHVLVVVVDDYLTFRTEEDKVILIAHAQKIIPDKNLDFGAIYLLGASGEYCVRAL